MSFPTNYSSAVYIHKKMLLQVWDDSLFSVFSGEQDIFDTFNVENIQRLFKNGADVNEVEKEYGMNFLQKCITEEFSLHNTEGEGFAKIIQTLFSAGLDLNHQDVEYCTALHLAIIEQQFDLAKLLLEKGANPSIVDCDGKTAYDYVNNFDPSLMPESIKKDREELLKLLQ